MSHETWQLVNSLKCRFFHILYWFIKTICSLFCKKNLLIKYILIYFYNNIIFFVILFGIKQLNKLWKKTFLTIYCFVGHPVVPPDNTHISRNISLHCTVYNHQNMYSAILAVIYQDTVQFIRCTIIIKCTPPY